MENDLPLQKFSGMKGILYILELSVLVIFVNSLLLQNDVYGIPPADQSYPHPDSINYNYPPSMDTLVNVLEWMGPHELMVQKPMREQPRLTESTKNIVTVWIIFGFVLIGLLRFIFPTRFKEVFMAAWESRYFNQIEREGGLITNWVSFFLYLNFLFSLSLLFYETLAHLNVINSGQPTHPFLILLYGLLLAAGFFF
jgi:hypothetical protein